jgi:hypothetical protein
MPPHHCIMRDIFFCSVHIVTIYIKKLYIIFAMGFKVYIGLKYATPKKIQIQILNSK